MMMMKMKLAAANMWRLGSAMPGDKQRWQLCSVHPVYFQVHHSHDDDDDDDCHDIEIREG